jgi:hypothetical protein
VLAHTSQADNDADAVRLDSYLFFEFAIPTVPVDVGHGDHHLVPFNGSR